ncbi:MAG: ATP-binding cassette domain-containing protein [Deltaproteobacteria bacterium]|nr:ATP-binding cassette domain-containing protein [Deltaproteobacteria bacterium]
MINIESLTKYFDDFCAVDQINFHIKKGEILGLLGPNGAGKTTTLRMLTGFLKPTSGSISVKDYTIDKHALEIKALLGYLPESAPLYHEMLVFDYLDYVANIRKIEKGKKIPRIRELADLCGINEVMHRPISQLSKGYKQRVGLAHAMMNDPEILVLDEPTSGLDPNQIVEIRNIIKTIGKTKTIIISTHILSEVEATCDRVVILNQGKIAADGTTEKLRQGMGDEYVIHICLMDADLASVKRELGAIDQVTGIEEDIDRKVNDEGTLYLKLNCRSSTDLRGDIYRKIKETAWTLLEFHQETQSLENIFRQLTKEN